MPTFRKQFNMTLVIRLLLIVLRNGFLCRIGKVTFWLWQRRGLSMACSKALATARSKGRSSPLQILRKALTLHPLFAVHQRARVTQ